MSKVKGNSVDPLDVIDKHGTDALRFTLTALAAPGTDPSFGEARLLGYKAFVNKLWNASRFVLMNLAGERAASYEFARLPLASRWILSRLQDTIGKMEAAFAEFRFDRAAHEIYHFLWDEFCDWSIEISKSELARPETAPLARAVLLDVLETALRLLHPIAPYVTEEIWQRLPHDGASIMVAAYPKADPAKSDAAAEKSMQRLMSVIVGIRTMRATYEVEPRRRIDVTLVASAPADRAFVADHTALVRDLARLERFEVVGQAADAPGTIKQVVDTFELRLPMAGLFDIAAEKARLAKERGKLEAELEGASKKLANPNFVERAKPEVVAETRSRIAELEARLRKIDETLR
jgi:valyl-tRNA synthetase